MLETILYVLYGVLLLVAGVAIWRLRYAYRHFHMKQLMTTAEVIEEKPGVTVCIPARNEMHAVTECLDRVIASSYPKLEIIVWDDLSKDNTSALIKAYAHEGVRFVEGSALPAGWVGKNHALQGLLREASGTYVLFMDVDTRVTPDAIEELVAYAVQEQALMVSILPRREDGWRGSIYFSTLRYFWEIMFHRQAAPATASNAWMVHRQTLLDRWQGLTAFKDAIQPESRLSAAFMKEGRYRFLIGTPMLGVGYEKKWRSQIDTSIRLLFPLLGARVPNAVVAFLDLLILASPLYILVAGFIAGWGIQQIFAGVFYLLFAGIYASYTVKVWKYAWWIGALLWPLIVLQEAVVLAASTIGYLRRTIKWKGRVVKIPTQTQASLPGSSKLNSEP